MAQDNAQKPQPEEWLHWSETVIERLTTCAHTYDKPPHEDIFMPEKNLHQRKTKVIDLLRRIHMLAEQIDPSGDNGPVEQGQVETVIAGLALLFQETLDQLPALSTDMQKLLKSRWDNHCNGRIASELFRGRENENEGIGTGKPEHGRLPLVLFNLIDREQAGGSRSPQTLQNAAQNAAHKSETEQDDGPRRHTDGRRGWTGRVGSAGRMD